MQSTSSVNIDFRCNAEIILRCLQPGMVHISRQTKDHLPKDRYVVENRGLIKLKVVKLQHVSTDFVTTSFREREKCKPSGYLRNRSMSRTYTSLLLVLVII
jgi:hypothetical protein